MASIQSSAYLPPLDKCLNGEETPISWKWVSSILRGNCEAESECKIVESFLDDQDVLNVLLKPFNAYSSPSTVSKEMFEAKTSAINIVPASDSHYDIKEIKEDSLWLSKEVGIDEVSALRIIILECHNRSTAQLCSPFSEEELANLQEATGNGKYANSVAHILLPQGLQVTTIREQFEKLESRRQRILQTFFSETRFLWHCAEHLMHFLYTNFVAENGEDKSNENATSWLFERERDLTALIQISGVDAIILKHIDAIRNYLQNLGTGSGLFKDDGGCEELEVDWIQTKTVEVTLSMKIVLYFLLYSIELPSSQIVLEWFRLLQSFEFLDQFGSDDTNIQRIVLPLRALSAVISVTMLENLNPLISPDDPDNLYQVSSNHAADRPFILNPNSISAVHSIILQAADSGLMTAGPVILAWSTLLQTMSFRVDAEGEILVDEDIPGNLRPSSQVTDTGQIDSSYENVLKYIRSTVEDDIVDYLARQAVNICRVFDTITDLSDRLGSSNNAVFSVHLGCQMRNSFLQLIRKFISVGYIPEIICATISIISGGNRYWELVSSTAGYIVEDPTVKFLNDSVLVDSFLKISQSRYPYESLPFLQFIRTLASSPIYLRNDDPHSILRSLEVMPVFTFTLPIDYADYETIQEEDNHNNVILTRNVNLFEPRFKNFANSETASKSMSLTRVDQDFVIQAGSLGRIISESGPRVAYWFHQYSALKYFGKLLETSLAASDHIDGTTGMSADPESISEIIDILAILINSISRSTDPNQNGVENAGQVLEIASSGLSRNRDIITVVFTIFEEGLQNVCGRSGLALPLQILTSCVHFIHAILPLYSYRVWPMLANSGILSMNKTGETLPTIVESIERPLGYFDFLLSCTHLFKSLVDDLVNNALRRKINNQSSANFSGVQNIGTSSPDQFVTKTLLSFTKYLVDVLENLSSWKYQHDEDRRTISHTITSSLDKILNYSYGVEVPMNSPTSMESKDQLIEDKRNMPLMGALIPSATYIVESFLSVSSGNLRFEPLLRSYLDGLERVDPIIFPQQSELWKNYVISSLLFSRTLLRVGVLLDRPSSQLEKLLFCSSPLIARLYCMDDYFSIPVINLLESLVLAATSHEPEPPSLLGHLGPQTARNFLHIISILDEPLSRSENLNSIWSFLGSVVSSRQQWFSNYLLTGKTPRDALKSKSSGKEMIILEKPLIATALQRLSRVTEIPLAESLSMLGFVALSLNFWPWTVCNTPLYSQFIQKMLDYVGNLTPPQIRQQAGLTKAVEVCYETKIAASFAEILAMHFFHSRQTGASVDLKDLLSNLKYYERFGVSTLNYNSSLHGLLKQNFETRYSGCSPWDFKRTTLSKRSFGKDFFFDLDLADKMLERDVAWSGRNGDDGMRAEFERANVNLSHVDSQIALFQGWKLLSLELSNWFPEKSELRIILSKVITDCLMLNCKAQPPEEIFKRLSQTRAEFALVLTQRLFSTKSTKKELEGLLKVVWHTVCELRGNFEMPIPDGDTIYYRLLLKLLFLSICVHSVTKLASDDEDSVKIVCFSGQSSLIPTIIEIVKYVVSRGLREIVTFIHEPAIEASPEDLALITGILQSCLRIPNISTSYSQITSIMISDGTPSIAMRLFSWSDRLAVDGDPIYGELSILFLLELSSIPVMAEQLAIDGLLTQISSASIMSYLQCENLGLANDAGSRRCYSIWARGILPLLLNILDSVQKSIAIEVAQFLNQFPALLRQSEIALEAPLINRIPEHESRRSITFLACSEVHSMALIIYILDGFRESLKGTMEIPPVKWDSNLVLENVEFWLGSRAILRDRILPTNEREIEMMKMKDEDSPEVICELEEKIVEQLTGIRDILDTATADSNSTALGNYNFSVSHGHSSSIGIGSKDRRRFGFGASSSMVERSSHHTDVAIKDFRNDPDLKKKRRN
ncbi:Nucleoporin NUP188 [Golovinomyces cichoracearum]|uniref:Nucleoporin NUP188 n=1 Tax=Golovinomyces cichoracearum TaxID=62708 RepID=A0A420HTB9_9PEZI|nr:Nucleoporin NUP188 [Golovinomyces cichoracearum]